MNQHCAAKGCKPHTHCSDCRLSSICLPLSLEFSDIDRLDAIVERGKPLQKGDYLYQQGDQFKAIYAIRSGALKTYTTTADGTEQITGFYLPGEVVGLDGPAEDCHVNSAAALHTTSVCAIPFHKLEELSRTIPGLQRNLLQLLSREINADQKQFRLLGASRAESRIAALLLSLSARFARHKLSATEFTLPMSRSDIGNFLGLTLETVSRVFSRLQQMNLIHANRRDITLLNLEQLNKICAGDSGCL